MLGVLALLGLAAVASRPSRPRGRGLGDLTSERVYLLKPVDFVHPAMRESMERQAEAAGGPWAVVNTTWEGATHYPTAKAARAALTAAGYKGPYGKGTSSRWSR